MTYENVIALLALLSQLGLIDVPQTHIQTDAVQTVLASSAYTVPASTVYAAGADDVAANTTLNRTDGVFTVPYYSQLRDITPLSWGKKGCGIASLAMLIDYYKPGTVNINTLLHEGINYGAYINDVGWSYAGLIGISRKYGLTGASYDLGGQSVTTAFAQFKKAVEKGPVMASVHYTFDPSNPIPHLVIVTGIKDGRLYYNDPAFGKAGDSIPISQFTSSWKKRYIEFWPA